MKLSPILKFIPRAIIAYLLVWVLTYVAMMLSRGDQPEFRECYEYFILGWTFEAGELPGIHLVVQLGRLCPAAGGVYLGESERGKEAILRPVRDRRYLFNFA